MRSSDCPYTVQFYGALFREGDVWICMEVMDTSLDKFYVKVYKNERKIPEYVLGRSKPKQKVAQHITFYLFERKNCVCCRQCPTLSLF